MCDNKTKRYIALLGDNLNITRSKISKNIERIRNGTAIYDGVTVSVGKETNVIISVRSSQTFTYEHKACIDAVGTLIQNNADVSVPFRLSMSLNQIARCLYGLPPKSKVSDKLLDRTETLVDFLRNDITADINYKAQIDKCSFKSNSNGIISGPLICADKVEVMSGGNKAKGYLFYRLPLVYEYSHDINQIIQVKQKFLYSPGKTTIENALIKRYLLQEINLIKRGTVGNRRKYETIFNELGFLQLSKQNKKTYKNNIKNYLDFLKGIEHIQGYSEYKSGNAIIGVDIKV